MNAAGSTLGPERLLPAVWADLRSCWAAMAGTVLLYMALATVILLPLIGALLRFLIARTHTFALADLDIARFLFASAPGVIALILVTALLVSVTAIEQACLMCTGLGRARGVLVRVRDAFEHAGRRTGPVLVLTILLVVRLVILMLPFAVAFGVVYWFVLRQYDINYYLTARPPAFWAAALAFGAIGLVLALLLFRLIIRWILILPLVVFEGISPVSAFAESARRMRGRGREAVWSLVSWAVLALALSLGATPVMRALGRLVAPAFGQSMIGLLIFVGLVAITWLLMVFAINVLVAALFALISVRLYVRTEPAGSRVMPRRSSGHIVVGERKLRIPWVAAVVLLVAAVLLAAAAAHLFLQGSLSDRPVLIFAHRGDSSAAPENTLAAFRRAGTEHTDFVELDVQETADGVVVVAHDKDLMKVARMPLKIWSSTAAQLRAIDIGSYYSKAYSDQRVPTLAEALSVCKGVSNVDIELKDYGHDQQLEARVIALVEAAGMQKQIVTMSLSGKMVANMKRLRPEWTSGLLIAKAIGNVTRLPVDFLAVESRMATRRLVRSAHAAGKPVYVWTVNDPQRMIRLIGLGVDGLITDSPALGREVVTNYSGTGPAQRLFLYVMTRLGMREEISEPEWDLRP
jgi:glycerophosphoryl diester phosphodiesterase